MNSPWWAKPLRGRGLLELVKRVPADLAFVDISMPGYVWP